MLTVSGAAAFSGISEKDSEDDQATGAAACLWSASETRPDAWPITSWMSVIKSSENRRTSLPARARPALRDVRGPAIQADLLATFENLNPNLVAMTTRSRVGASASPTSSSLVNGPLSVIHNGARRAQPCLSTVRWVE
jgi:hypothetical protein